MTVKRVLSVAALAAILALGSSSFVPASSACGGSTPGSCRDAATVDADLALVWLDTARLVVGLFG